MVNRIPAGADKAMTLIEHIESLRANRFDSPRRAGTGAYRPTMSGLRILPLHKPIDGGDLAD